MKEMILILIGSALVNNVVLSQFLGLCPFLGVSKKTKTAAERAEQKVKAYSMQKALKISSIYFRLRQIQ